MSGESRRVDDLIGRAVHMPLLRKDGIIIDAWREDDVGQGTYIRLHVHSPGSTIHRVVLTDVMFEAPAEKKEEAAAASAYSPGPYAPGTPAAKLLKVVRKLLVYDPSVATGAGASESFLLSYLSNGKVNGGVDFYLTPISLDLLKAVLEQEWTGIKRLVRTDDDGHRSVYYHGLRVRG